MATCSSGAVKNLISSWKTNAQHEVEERVGVASGRDESRCGQRFLKTPDN